MTVSAGTAPRRNAHATTTRRQHRAAYILVLPFLIIFTAMLIVPLAYSAYLSFFRTQLVGGEEFAWLANYLRAFTDPSFLGGLGRMAIFLVIQVPIMLGLALFFALALDSSRIRAPKALRLLFFVPYAVPGVVATLVRAVPSSLASSTRTRPMTAMTCADGCAASASPSVSHARASSPASD